MNNNEFIRGTFDEIQTPDALFGKVINMNKKQSKMRNIMKYATRAAAAFAILFVGSNGICYAATGETWVEKIIVNVNGEEKEVDLVWTEEDDTLTGTATFVVDEEDDAEPVEYMLVIEDEEGSSKPEVNVVGQEDSDTKVNIVTLEEKDSKIYLNIGAQSIDITEDFADGKTEFESEVDGKKVKITVTGTVDEYYIEIIEE